MKQHIPTLVTAIIFIFASYNVYTYFEAQQQRKAEANVKRLAHIEAERAKIQEQERQAELEHQVRKNELELQQQRTEAELLEKKLANEQRLTRYEELKQAQKIAKQQRWRQRRINDARNIGNPEHLPASLIKAITDATAYEIRQNPKDYQGDYTPSSSIIETPTLTKRGATGLMMFAMVSQDQAALAELIKLGYDINEANADGYTPLLFASAYNQPEIVAWFIDQGAEINQRDRPNDSTALHLAAKYNPLPEVLEVLLEANANIGNISAIEQKNRHGETPLLLAARYNQNPQVIDKLVKLGASVSVTDNLNRDPYSYFKERLDHRYPTHQVVRIDDEYHSDILAKLRGE